MTIQQAKLKLESRMQRRFDGFKAGWSVDDAIAVRLMLTHVRQLEAKTRL